MAVAWGRAPTLAASAQHVSGLHQPPRAAHARAAAACAAQPCAAAQHSTAARGAARTACRSGAYDHPALYSNEDAFAERTYWDRRFQGEALGHEWYRGYESLRPVLTRHLPCDAQLLQIGVGTSGIQNDMVLLDGYTSITSVDYSPVAIARLEAARASSPRPLSEALRFAVGDMRDLSDLGDDLAGDESYRGVLDKGALDALLCGDNAEGDAAAALGEVWRVLAPGAPYVMVTSASPRSRLPALRAPRRGGAWSRILVYEIGQQGALVGPLDTEADAAAIEELPSLGYSHFAYCCFK